MPATCQTGSGPTFRPWLFRFGTLPPIAVTQGESSQAAVSGVAEVVPHWLLAMARFCTTPQSPVATSTGMPAAAAVSSPASCEVISTGPAWEGLALIASCACPLLQIRGAHGMPGRPPSGEVAPGGYSREPEGSTLLVPKPYSCPPPA
jgi:hypothetical protein